MEDEIKAIEQEISDFEQEQAACEARIRMLQTEEDPANGVYRHEEIHAAKQDKLRLACEVQLRRVKINRLRLG